MSVSSRACMQGIWDNWWTHCLTRESQYQIYSNHPTRISLSAAGATVAFIVVMCFLLFLIKNNYGCSIRVYGLYLNELGKINVFPVASCPNIWEHVIISDLCLIRTTLALLHSRYLGCRDSDTFISFNVGCTFPTFFLIGWSYFWLVEVTFDWLKIFCVILPIVRSNVLRIYFTLAVAAIDDVESAMVAAIV